MSNNSGNHFDNSLILYFFIITAVLYSSLFIGLDYLGYSFSDVPDNGNLITPVIETTLDMFSTFADWLTSFSLDIFGWEFTPFGFLSGSAEILGRMFDALILFVNVWNILPIYVFYIIFIPYAIITFLIIFDLVIRLIEGLIP
jgi:hypothetical protein